MKVSIIGPGALGCVFAARMARGGVTTTLVDHRPERAQRLAKSGIVVETPDETITEMPAVVTDIPTRQDLVIVLVKAHATPHLRLPTNVPILTLQNGLGNVEILCDLAGSSHIIAGSTSEAATLLEEGRVRHVAPGQTTFGTWTSCPTDTAVGAFTAAGFDWDITDAPGQLIWEKAAISAGINPLTALLDVPNGRLLELQEARQLLRDLVVEAAKVAATEGYRFPFSLVERAEEVCEQTADNISSMLQDIRAGRKTEIEAISGEILQRAELASLPTPRTRVVWQLLKSLEER